MNIYGLCIHGLAGDLFSNSMNGLAARLNTATPEGCHFTIVGGDDPRVYTAMIEAGLDDAIAKGATPILIGHSLGADMVVQECNRLKGRGIKVPLAGVVDPVDWTSNSTQAGIWQISDNVDVVINPYQNNYPGGGHVERAANNDHTDVRLMHMPQYPHASITGYDIGSCPETQNALVEAVQSYIASIKEPTS